MLIKAVQKYTRQSPRKVRLIANTVRKLSVDQALKQLAVIEKKATMVVSKVMRQAIADAVHNHGYQLSDLSIDNILVNEGPRYRRFQPVSRGRAHGIIKRTCHITVVLKTKEEEAKPVAPQKEEVKSVATAPKADAPKKKVRASKEK
jgi:large subunit ribosomal protein L22